MGDEEVKAASELLGGAGKEHEIKERLAAFHIEIGMMK